MQASIRNYLSDIGRRGGKKSRRRLTVQQAQDMVRVREARRAFARYRTRCFWSTAPDYGITLKDVKWVGEQLCRYGDREAFYIGQKLCR